jgi:hypothetical protein
MSSPPHPKEKSLSHKDFLTILLTFFFLSKLSGRYEVLKESMSETASIPPSWCTLAEVMITFLNPDKTRMRVATLARV